MSLDEDWKLVRRIDDWGQGLTSWEADFVESCLGRLGDGLELTPKMREIAERIERQRVDR